MPPRYLTKSRFKLGMECPTKLYYTGKKEYADQSLDDPFLAALAEGGFQVGELAKCYFSGGHDIATLDPNEALRLTDDFLKLENVTIYEAAIRFKNFFIRVDILRKTGDCVELIEVKSKSFDPDTASAPFLNTKGELSSSWKPYLYDVAFQAYVLSCAKPEFKVSPFLMLADKSAPCPVDDLNQKFRIRKAESNRKHAIVIGNLTAEDLSVPILRCVSVAKHVGMIWGGEGTGDFFPQGFEGTVAWLADAYADDRKILPSPDSKCKSCAFRASEKELAQEVKSGFHECWKEAFGWNDADFLDQDIFALWAYRKKDEAIAAGKLKLTALTEEDLQVKDDGRPGLSSSARQLLQVQKAKTGDDTPYLDREGLRMEIKQWRYPLHFIDFETSIAPIPFNKGRVPYEILAFQFSHHLVENDGSVSHAGEYLCSDPGRFPNFDFVRALKAQLGRDQGSVFRYSNHENTVLVQIYRQLAESGVDDRDELMEFITTITASGKVDDGDSWEGVRNMIDLWHLVKRYYYDPAINGSNSIKYVLPAILNSSAWLQEKYSCSIYGAAGGIRSLNFKDWRWIEKGVDGKIRDPYALLPPLFSDVDERNQYLLISSEAETIKNGGAAMTAYVRLQYEEMGAYERAQIEAGLKKYCELDTMAMVMIYEAWKEWLF